MMIVTKAYISVRNTNLCYSATIQEAQAAEDTYIGIDLLRHLYDENEADLFTRQILALVLKISGQSMTNVRGRKNYLV